MFSFKKYFFPIGWGKKMWNNEYLESVNLFFVYVIVIAIFCIVSMLFVMYLLAIKVFPGKGILFLKR